MKEILMKVAEGGGMVAFGVAYVFGVTVYVMGGWSSFVAEIKKDFGPMPAMA